MKIKLLFLIFISFLVSCANNVDEDLPKEITIAGKIINYNRTSGKNVLTIYVNDNGRADQLSYSTRIDSLGYFNVKFERYYPQDVMISYKTNFRVIVHPGDSLYVEFNGDTRQRTKIFETVKFSGNSSKLNEDLAIYLKNYFETRPSSIDRKNFKALSLEEYKNVQDSIRLSRIKYVEYFLEKHKPNKELETWINSSIEYSYFDNLLSFPEYSRYDEYPSDWHVEYFKFIESIPPISIESIIYSDTRWLINQYLSGYISRILFNFGGKLKTTNFDSLMLNKIIELSPEKGLIKQLTLTEYLNQCLSKYKLAAYEENQNLISENIDEIFLTDPLANHYNEVKSFLEKPVKAEDLVANNFKDQEAIDIWNKILEDGKGKVLYIDCWGTWCGACLNEIPHAIQMYENYTDKDIEFVYLCFGSKENQWHKIINQFNLKGNHYFLNTVQESFFVELFGISGYPTYVIIDRNGNIVRKGSSFRPSNKETETIINNLL